MPKLALLAACDNVLLDDDQNPTLVSVFCALDAANQGGGEIPNNALAPKIWFVLSMWFAEQNEIGKSFTQKIQIVLPDGSEFGSGSEEFTMVKRSHTLKIRVVGLPIGYEGKITVKAWLESLNTHISDTHEYEIDIRHKRVASGK